MRSLIQFRRFLLRKCQKFDSVLPLLFNTTIFYKNDKWPIKIKERRLKELKSNF